MRRYRPLASGSANTGTSGAPVRNASVASADVVAAGRLKKSTFTASAPCDVLIDQHGDASFALSARSTRRTAPCR